MLQEINLYKLLPSRSRFALTKELVITTYVLLVAVLTLIYFVQAGLVYNVSYKLDKVTAQTAEVQKKLDELNAKYPINDFETLNKSLNELQVQFEHKKNAINLLLPNAVFSSYLLALANTDVQGVWLTHIKIDNIEQKVDIMGLAVQSSLVEKFLGQVAAQPVFADKLEFEIDDLSDTTIPASFNITNKIVKPLL